MTTSQKAALSLLISVVLVAGFSVLAFTGLFDLIETRFYNPSVTNSVAREAGRDAETIEDFFDELQARFSDLLRDGAVQRSFLPTQAAHDIFERTRLYSILLESERGIQSVRFIDAGGMRLHFSTNPADILSQTSYSISYKNYDEVTPYVPYTELAVPAEGSPRIILDQQNERIVFSFPFHDALEVYRGTALYSLSVRVVVDRLVAAGRLKIGEDVSIVSSPPGMVSGLPNTGREEILSVISAVWQEGLFDLTSLDSGYSAAALALVSARTSQGLTVGRVVSESLFAFPQPVKVILVVAIFLTVFLTIFLIFNIQPDTITVIQNRLKGLQLSLIRDYYERKGEMDWNHWYHELEQRREDVRAELKRGITGKPAAILEDIDSLIDKSWDEILTAIGGRRETRLAIDEDKLQNILSRMLVAAGNMPAVSGSRQTPPPAAQPGAEGLLGFVPKENSPEGFDDLADAPVASLTEQSWAEETGGLSLEPASMEEIMGEVEELGGPDEEIEELIEEEPEEIEEIEEIEELEDIEELENIGEIENIDEIGNTGEIKEPEDAGKVRPIFSNVSASDESDVASKIEFSPSDNEEESLLDLNSEFEIVSPFSDLQSQLKETVVFTGDDDVDGQETKTSGRLEELDDDFSMSLVYKPFQNESTGEPQELVSVAGDIIKQKNGVNYVNKKVKSPGFEAAKTLDPGLKSLVDSVIGKK